MSWRIRGYAGGLHDSVWRFGSVSRSQSACRALHLDDTESRVAPWDAGSSHRCRRRIADSHPHPSFTAFDLLTVELLVFGLPTLLFVGLQHARESALQSNKLSEIVWRRTRRKPRCGSSQSTCMRCLFLTRRSEQRRLFAGMAMIPLAGAAAGVGANRCCGKGECLADGVRRLCCIDRNDDGKCAAHRIRKLGKAFDAKRLSSYSLKKSSEAASSSISPSIKLLSALRSETRSAYEAK